METDYGEKKVRDKGEADTEVAAFLGTGTEFNGTLTFEGTIRIDGKVSGEVISQDTLVVGISTDVLYQLAEQRELVDHLPNAHLAILEASHGHDAFLIELETMNDLVRSWRISTIDPHVLVSM